jgi:hypothetical protein
VSKALQSLKESYPESTSEMKLIPVTEIEVTDNIKSLKKKKTHQDMMEFLIIF